ncbi:hypothetical protein KIH74_14765 [Kineosporia sp. J2-2]|uniref:HNH endonuclease n=1 Tax=Kineosporia corallincola TaxID=2835133 RepID=A0ABS5TGN1_9ACTN|nr:DUF6300 family protein [Kineosporia corallincola]MBT0770200.1 hypothetical protein [Kineosporia corallincola]
MTRPVHGSPDEPAPGCPLIVETTEQAPTCPGCGRQGILAATVPHTVTDERGHETTGTAVAVLCQTCHLDDPQAGPLITYFAVHGSITAETLEQATSLVAGWLAAVRVEPFSGEGPERQNEA